MTPLGWLGRKTSTQTNKWQWIFTKLGVDIDVVEIWFGIDDGQISSIFNRELPATRPYFPFLDCNFSNCQWIFTKFGMCIDIVENCFGIAHWQISSIIDRVICPRHDNGGVLPFHVLFYNAITLVYICLISLRKHAYSNILKSLQPKKENFQIKKKNDIFHISAQNIGCGYSLVPTIYVLNRNMKNNLYPCKPPILLYKNGVEWSQNYICVVS